MCIIEINGYANAPPVLQPEPFRHSQITPISYTCPSPLSYHHRRPHRITRRYSRQYTRIAHSESAYSVRTAALAHDPTILKTSHATGGREMVDECNVLVNVIVEEGV